MGWKLRRTEKFNKEILLKTPHLSFKDEQETKKSFRIFDVESNIRYANNSELYFVQHDDKWFGFWKIISERNMSDRSCDICGKEVEQENAIYVCHGNYIGYFHSSCWRPMSKEFTQFISVQNRPLKEFLQKHNLHVKSYEV